MARKATEEQQAAKLKKKVQTVKKSLEEPQHTADDVLKDVAQKQQEVQQTVQQFQAPEEARAIAAKEAQSAAEVADREEQIEHNKESRTQVAAEKDARSPQRQRRLRTACRMNSLSSRVN